MAIKHQRILRKEVLHCRCMRYVYEQGVEVLYCDRHSKIIDGKLHQPEVIMLIHNLYTEPAYIFRPRKKHWRYVRRAGYAIAALTAICWIGYTLNNVNVHKEESVIVSSSIPSLTVVKDNYLPTQGFSYEINWGLTKGISKGYPANNLLKIGEANVPQRQSQANDATFPQYPQPLSAIPGSHPSTSPIPHFLLPRRDSKSAGVE